MQLGRTFTQNALQTLQKCLLGSLSHSVWYATQNPLHHGQVLAVVMRLEERYAHVELEHYAPNRPDVAWLSPSEFCITTELRN